MKAGYLPVLAVVAALSLSTAGATTVCWKDTIDRGVGKPVHACPAGQQEDGGLCYPACKATYYGVGPARKASIWQSTFPLHVATAWMLTIPAHCFVIP